MLSITIANPITISGLSLPNRLVRSATNDGMADREGLVTERLCSHYQQLARGGAGLLITGFMSVHTSGRSVPGQLNIETDKALTGLLQLTTAVHREKGRIIAQLAHGGRQTRLKHNADAMDPSGVPDRETGLHAKAMTDADIDLIINAFCDAIVRARCAGFDGVQLHAAHGYLLSEYLSPYTNKRTDQWGGSIQNRTRIITEIVSRARDRAGDLFPILIKLNGDDGLNEGLHLDEAMEIAKILEHAGISAIEVSGGMNETDFDGRFTIRGPIQSEAEEGYFRAYSRKIKAAVSIPVISVGGYRSVSVMNQVLQNQSADLIALSRPFICEPDIARQLLHKQTATAKCMSCTQCFSLRGIVCNAFKNSNT